MCNGQKVNSHQILSQKYQPVVYLCSKLRPDLFRTHHLGFGPLFQSIRQLKALPVQQKQNMWPFVKMSFCHVIINRKRLNKMQHTINLWRRKYSWCLHNIRLYSWNLFSPPCVKYSRLIYLKRHKILILTFIFPWGAVLALCFPGNWCLTLCPVSLTFSFDFERLVYW